MMINDLTTRAEQDILCDALGLDGHGTENVNMLVAAFMRGQEVTRTPAELREDFTRVMEWVVEAYRGFYSWRYLLGTGEVWLHNEKVYGGIPSLEERDPALVVPDQYEYIISQLMEHAELLEQIDQEEESAALGNLARQFARHLPEANSLRRLLELPEGATIEDLRAIRA